jgi:hypothetical protein
MTARATAGAIEQDESSGTLGTSSPASRTYECDACGRCFDGEPAGAGLFLWTRGDEVRYEEPPLCEQCASKITVGALLKWDTEDEEEG